MKTRETAATQANARTPALAPGRVTLEQVLQAAEPHNHSMQPSETTRKHTARDLQVARARIALLAGLPRSTGGAGLRAQPPQQPFATPSAPQVPFGGEQRNAAAQAPVTHTGARQ